MDLFKQSTGCTSEVRAIWPKIDTRWPTDDIDLTFSLADVGVAVASATTSMAIGAILTGLQEDITVEGAHISGHDLRAVITEAWQHPCKPVERLTKAKLHEAPGKRPKGRTLHDVGKGKVPEKGKDKGKGKHAKGKGASRGGKPSGRSGAAAKA